MLSSVAAVQEGVAHQRALPQVIRDGLRRRRPLARRAAGPATMPPHQASVLQRQARPARRRWKPARAGQAQHLGARGLASSRSQSLSTWRLKPGRQVSLPGRCVWPCTSSAAPMACIQRTAAGVDVGPLRRRNGAARCAGAADLGANLQPLGQRLGQEAGLPGRGCAPAAEGLVGQVVQAQCVAVAQQQPLPQASARWGRAGPSCRSRSISLPTRKSRLPP
jgi:hypothetical protein